MAIGSGGPVVKIDRASLPRRPNIHFFGSDLTPIAQLVAGWDVCLLPFAINAATRFYQSYQNTRYMAAGKKPIVSTGITDVSVPYGKIVPYWPKKPEHSSSMRGCIGPLS